MRRAIQNLVMLMMLALLYALVDVKKLVRRQRLAWRKEFGDGEYPDGL